MHLWGSEKMSQAMPGSVQGDDGRQHAAWWLPGDSRQLGYGNCYPYDISIGYMDLYGYILNIGIVVLNMILNCKFS